MSARDCVWIPDSGSVNLKLSQFFSWLQGSPTSPFLILHAMGLRLQLEPAQRLLQLPLTQPNLAAEIPCEWVFATKFASDCECDGVVHSGLLALWSWCPPGSPETPQIIRVTQKWLKSDSRGSAPKWLKSDSKWGQVTFESFLSHFGADPRESLFSHFWVTLRILGLGPSRRASTLQC